ncbi:hypothetical protein DUNSADRAFT_6786 [Dunaliella salina]|uniref:Uncharacterized protein n=1 Tax=Dunaliella salina TaxID=3046 RepID=A0ABQ7GML3_DUNSA|nr:hypothetical protein DUNSADRAFT_6786 [Dunaliella salina]|eukprot:KAF5835853.1 hypothetical protein DUNSADRAFT_6786 [Dunaliella salina]
MQAGCWFVGHVLADDDHKMRGRILATSRARAPDDYIFENMCMSKPDKFWRVLGIRTLYLVMLIACALIVSGLSSRTRVDLDLTQLGWTKQKLAVDIARAGEAIPAGSTDLPSAQLRGLYEEAMQEAASQATTPAYSTDLALKANFTDFCHMALVVCADYYNRELGGGEDNVTLILKWGRHFMWGEPNDRFTYERRLMRKLDDRSLMGEEDPTDYQGTDIALTACAACYCSGLNDAEKEEQKTGRWLSLTQSHCWAYTLG